MSVEVTHEASGRTVSVSATQARALVRRGGWRLVAETGTVEVTTLDEAEPRYISGSPFVDPDELETYERVTPRFDSPDSES